MEVKVPKTTKLDYTNLILALKEEFGFSHEDIHDDIAEFYLPNSEPLVYLFRLVYEVKQKDIIMSFSVDLSSTDAIYIFCWAKEKFRKLTLGPVFYISSDNEVSLGDEAEANYMSDLELSISEELMAGMDGEPVTAVSNEPIYSAEDPRALEALNKFERAKKGLIQ